MRFTKQFAAVEMLMPVVGFILSVVAPSSARVPVFAILVVCSFVNAIQAQELQITGTIALHGCLARPNEFVLKANTIGINGAVSNARIEAVPGSARQFTFSITALQPGDIHFLELHFNGMCGPVFWQGPAEGLVQSGETVALDGYARLPRRESRCECVNGSLGLG